MIDKLLDIIAQPATAREGRLREWLGTLPECFVFTIKAGTLRVKAQWGEKTQNIGGLRVTHGHFTSLQDGEEVGGDGTFVNTIRAGRFYEALGAGLAIGGVPIRVEGGTFTELLQIYEGGEV